jgi:hypothetical protein
MIGKVAATGSGFRGVVNYLLLGKRDVPNPDRVAWTMGQNLLTDDPDRAPALMRATANQSTRCKKPVYHLAIAWHENENPSDALMREIGAQTLKDLALEEHQALFIAHKDTAHRHLHIVINRVHPETGKAWSQSNDFKRIEISLRQQAEARGLPYVPGRFNDPEKFAGKGRGVKDGEFQAAVRSGKPAPKSMWGRDDIKNLRAVLAPAFGEATSWDDLNSQIAALGFRIAPKGQGLIIEGADGFMKLSDLGKQIRIKSLEDTFGESFSNFAARSPVLPEAALKTGAGIIPVAHKNLDSPVQSSRSQDAGDALLSPPAKGNGERHAFTENDRDALRRAWIDKRAAAPRKIKPAAANTDDDTPVASIPQPLDPKQSAYQRIRTARADLARLQRQALDGNPNAKAIISAQLELEEARNGLEAILADSIDRTSAAIRPAAAEPVATRPEQQRPASAPRTAAPVPTLTTTPAEARGNAFNALRNARQMQDMAEALFNAGVISADDLKAAAADVKRAAESLRPHLTLREQLQNDLADALRRKSGKPAPKKGPSR